MPFTLRSQLLVQDKATCGKGKRGKGVVVGIEKRWDQRRNCEKTNKESGETKEYVLAAETDVERERWMKALASHVDDKGFQKSMSNYLNNSRSSSTFLPGATTFHPSESTLPMLDEKAASQPQAAPAPAFVFNGMVVKEGYVRYSFCGQAVVLRYAVLIEGLLGQFYFALFRTKRSFSDNEQPVSQVLVYGNLVSPYISTEHDFVLGDHHFLVGCEEERTEWAAALHKALHGSVTRGRSYGKDLSNIVGSCSCTVWMAHFANCCRVISG